MKPAVKIMHAQGLNHAKGQGLYLLLRAKSATVKQIRGRGNIQVLPDMEDARGEKQNSKNYRRSFYRMGQVACDLCCKGYQRK
jgi:hypothetical protein